jgi:hypothetical protein
MPRKRRVGKFEASGTRFGGCAQCVSVPPRRAVRRGTSDTSNSPNLDNTAASRYADVPVNKRGLDSK